MAYATVEELEQRWRDLSEDESKRAESLLEDAALILDTELEAYGLDPKAEGMEAKLRYVSCEMVRRKMASADYGDVTSISRTAGSFNEQISPANPSGNLYLTKAERKLLGIPAKRSRIGQVSMA